MATKRSAEFSYPVYLLMDGKMWVRTGTAVTIAENKIQVDKKSLSEYIVFEGASVRSKNA